MNNVSHDTPCPGLHSNRALSKKNLGLYPYANLLGERKIETHLGRQENFIMSENLRIVTRGERNGLDRIQTGHSTNQRVKLMTVMKLPISSAL
jgi:hypothetical protein